MIKSMTAYANVEEHSPLMTVTAEIRAVNHRYLDLMLRAPQVSGIIEEKIRQLITEKVSRGRLEVRLQLVPTSLETQTIEIDYAAAEAYYQRLYELNAHFRLDTPISLDHLLKANGIFRSVASETDPEELWPIIESCLLKAIDALNGMKEKEGAHLAADLSARIDMIEACLAKIRSGTENLPSLYRDRLKERLEKLTCGLVALDPERIAQEAAFLADKSDITEELVRAASHVQQFRNLMQAPEPAGRSLIFLLQELQREFNTMGAKAGQADTAHIIVDAKTELEKIREQAQNVE